MEKLHVDQSEGLKGFNMRPAATCFASSPPCCGHAEESFFGFFVSFIVTNPKKEIILGPSQRNTPVICKRGHVAGVSVLQFKPFLKLFFALGTCHFYCPSGF